MDKWEKIPFIIHNTDKPGTKITVRYKSGYFFVADCTYTNSYRRSFNSIMDPLKGGVSSIKHDNLSNTEIVWI